MIACRRFCGRLGVRHDHPALQRKRAERPPMNIVAESVVVFGRYRTRSSICGRSIEYTSINPHITPNSADSPNRSVKRNPRRPVVMRMLISPRHFVSAPLVARRTHSRSSLSSCLRLVQPGSRHPALWPFLTSRRWTSSRGSARPFYDSMSHSMRDSCNTAEMHVIACFS